MAKGNKGVGAKTWGQAGGMAKAMGGRTGAGTGKGFNSMQKAPAKGRSSAGKTGGSASGT